MDLEHLTKGQIILLTLLVSFMTSIATGIVTVSLMQQMPAPVTQTINRVVERTLERVVEKKTNAQGITTTNEKTVVVKETDLISNAVQSALPSLVAIYITEPAQQQKSLSEETAVVADTQVASVEHGVAQDTSTSPVPVDTAEVKPNKRFLARGVYVGDGIVITDASRIPEIADPTAVKLSVVLLASGAELPVTAVKLLTTTAQLSVAKKSGTILTTGDVQSLQLGNTLVILGGGEQVQVATGVVSNLERDDKKKVIGLTVSGAVPQAGAVLVNLEGKMIAQYIQGHWLIR